MWTDTGLVHSGNSHLCVNANPDTFQSRIGVLVDAYRKNNEVYSLKLIGCKQELMISVSIALYTC